MSISSSGNDSVVSNVPTNEYIATIRGTGKGSEYWGTCDQCGKKMSEGFVRQYRRVWIRPDGTRILDHGHSGPFGHKECLERIWGAAIPEDTLVRKGNVFLAPFKQL